MTSRPIHRRHPGSRACALAVVAALGLAASVPAARAEDLMDVYLQAVQSDPVLQQAEAQSRIGEAGAAQSRALLLPQLNGRVAFNDDHGSSNSTDLVRTTGGGTAYITSGGHSEGRSRSESIGLDQVLFDLGRFADWRASKANAAATEAQYASARQELILRVARAYFQVLNDEQELKFAEANEKALQKQLDQAQAKYDVGFAAVTDVVDAKAQHDTAVANVISARNAVFNDRQALAEITGQPAKTLDALADKLPMQPPQPDNMDAWVQTALASNPSLQAQRDQVEAAGHDVTSARAGRLPTLGASVTYTRNPSWGPGNFINPAGLPGNVERILHSNSNSYDTTIGLVLSVPLFTGGGIHANIQRAIAQRDQAGDVLEQDRRTVISNTRSAFNAIKAGISSVEAQRQAVLSARTALEATQAGYQIGTRTIVDLLIAQQNYFQAQSAYSQARHALVVNRLNLKFASGTLSVDDLKAVNALLQ